MLSEGTKILEFNQYQKFDKAPFLFCRLWVLNWKNEGCKNNIENLSTGKVSKHIPSGFSMSAISSFRNIEIKHMCTEVKIVWRSFINS